MRRWLWLTAGLAGSAVVAYGAALIVELIAVAVGSAPLGLVGETTPTQPWVTPAVVVAALATFISGAWLSVRRFRRTHP